MTNSGHNMSGASIAGGWLGFSLSPHVAMDATPGSGIVDAHHGGVYYHPDAAASSPMSFYFGGADNVASASGGGYYSGISALPLRSDGSLCLADALRRSEQKHHGAEVSAPPKLEDFLGAGPAMALSLDNSSYYYGGAGHGHGLDNGGGQHHLPYATMPSSGGHNVYYDAHAAILDEQAAAAMEAAGWMARAEGCYDVDTGNGGEDGSGAIVPAGHGNPGALLHPLTLSMSSGSQSSCVTMQQAPAHAQAYGGEYVGQAIAVGASKKRTAGQQNKQPVVHRKCIDTFGQRTSKYRGVTRHRWTGRYEAHLWDNSCRKEGQTRKGRQVYLGGGLPGGAGGDEEHDQAGICCSPQKEEQRVLPWCFGLPGSHQAPPAGAVAGAHRPRLRQQGPLPRNIQRGGGRGGGLRRGGDKVPGPQRRHQLRHQPVRRGQDHGEQHAAPRRPGAAQEGRPRRERGRGGQRSGRPRAGRQHRGLQEAARGGGHAVRRRAQPPPPRPHVERFLLPAARRGVPGRRRGRSPGAGQPHVGRVVHGHEPEQLPGAEPGPGRWPQHAFRQARGAEAGELAAHGFLGVLSGAGQERRVRGAHAIVRCLGRRLTWSTTSSPFWGSTCTAVRRR